ncbi:MAG TPA: hypothetical protein VMS77_00910 [Conexivisphaerales archaeon]|nr:hypothetical protein [Conexivisphaerales archaeon]
MPYADLFGWWIASITFNILFVCAASVYLYRRRQKRSPDTSVGGPRAIRVAKDFTFVWILLLLFLLYVYSVSEVSLSIFVVGNIALQILLLAYVIRRGDPKGE